MNWISVKDQFPKRNAEVLVTNGKDVYSGFYTVWENCIGWGTPRWFREVTHWMPLPEPPDKDVRGQDKIHFGPGPSDD